MNKQMDMLQKEDLPGTLLIVENDKINRAMLKEIFKGDYLIEEVEDGEECLNWLAEKKKWPCALLLAAMMPGMSGIGVLVKLKESGLVKEVPVFLMTAHADEQTIEQGYGLGVADVMDRSVLPCQMKRRVDSAVELFASRREMEGILEKQKQQLIDKEVEIMNMDRGMIEALATAIEFRSGESGDHVRRISGITRYLLLHTPMGDGLEEEMVEQIAMASILHDVGKITIADSILNKPGKLTPEEYEIMKTHALQGAQILERIPQIKNHEVFRYAYDIARHHHERWDGSGYPDGLKGEEISPWAQVVSLADVYDALVSKRVYKKAYGFEQALDMIQNGECGAFNPRLVKAFLQIEKDLRDLYLERTGSDIS